MTTIQDMVDALRGPYKDKKVQCDLRKTDQDGNDTFCCQGVACDIHNPDYWVNVAQGQFPQWNWGGYSGSWGLPTHHSFWTAAQRDQPRLTLPSGMWFELEEDSEGFRYHRPEWEGEKASSVSLTGLNDLERFETVDPYDPHSARTSIIPLVSFEETADIIEHFFDCTAELEFP